MFQVVNLSAGLYARHQGKQVNSIDLDSDWLSPLFLTHIASRLGNMECIIRSFLHFT